MNSKKDNLFMPQLKITVTQEDLDFVSDYNNFGYKSKSEVVQAALESLKQQRLEQSAKTYQKIYANNQHQ